MLAKFFNTSNCIQLTDHEATNTFKINEQPKMCELHSTPIYGFLRLDRHQKDNLNGQSRMPVSFYQFQQTLQYSLAVCGKGLTATEFCVDIESVKLERSLMK